MKTFEQLLCQQSPHLRRLVQQAQETQFLHEEVVKLLPAPLPQHIKVLCQKGSTLIVSTSVQMAATRLKMLLPNILSQLSPLGIERIHIKILPPQQTHNAPKEKLHLSPHALQCFAQTAEQLAHHPKLAESLRQLVAQHQNNNK